MRLFNKEILFIVILLGLCCKVVAQEYVINGGFEVNSFNCKPPDQNFNELHSWSIINGSPDYFVETCPWDKNGAVFWEYQDTALQGAGFIGLSCRFNANNTFTTEAIMGRLSDSMVEGEMYEVSLSFRSQGFFQGFPDSLLDCPLRPYRHIDLYFSQDTIGLIQDFSTGRPQLSSTRSVLLDSDAIREHGRTDWINITSCYKAQGGEQFVGVALPFGDFGDLPSCVVMDNNATFYTFYFDIDNVSVTPLEINLESQIEVCEGDPIGIDDIPLPDIYNLQLLHGGSIMSDIDYQVGLNQYDLILPCDQLEYRLMIIQNSCEFTYYMANAFSPNGDMINDTFKPQFPRELKSPEFTLLIFDRWGNQVYQSRGGDDGWDGRIGNQHATPGTYSWVLRFDDDEAGVDVGTVLVVH